MNQYENSDQHRSDKMNGASALAAIEHRGQPGTGGVDSRRHSQTRGQEQGREPKDHSDIRQLLQHIIMSCCWAFWKSQPEMVTDIVRQVGESKFATPWEQVSA
jgi:hypothetical protein